MSVHRNFQPQQNSLISVDLVRAFAALSVFVYHYGIGQVLAHFTGVKSFEFAGLPGAVFAVPLFFAISGFCIHGAEWNRFTRAGSLRLKDYFLRRIRRIYPVYCFALLISIAVNAANGSRITLTDLVVHAFLLQGFTPRYFNTINLVLWTISIEACFYVIYPLWLKVRVKYGLPLAFGLGGAVTIASWCVTGLWFYPYSLPAQWFFLNTWIGWLAGAVLAEKIAGEPGWFSRPLWWIFGVVAWIGFLSASASGALDGQFLLLRRPLLIAISLWPLSWAVLNEQLLRRREGTIKAVIGCFAALGLSSYSLYLLHEPLIGMRNLLQTGLNPGGVRLGLQIIWFPIILGLCWASYRFVELHFMGKGRSVAILNRE